MMDGFTEPVDWNERAQAIETVSETWDAASDAPAVTILSALGGEA